MQPFPYQSPFPKWPSPSAGNPSVPRLKYYEGDDDDPIPNRSRRLLYQPGKWGGQNYNLGQNLFQANRGDDWDYDPVPSRSASMLPAAQWGDRELDRQALGYYSAAYDPGYSEFYSPQAQTSYSPYYDPSGGTFYNPYQEIMSY